MKREWMIGIILALMIAMISGCSESEMAKEPQETEGNVKQTSSEPFEGEEDETQPSEPEEAAEDQQSDIEPAEETQQPADSQDLSDFTNRQIEYARVWLQLGPHQDIDVLNVRRIPAGEKLNPEDTTSIGYPEDVIQLSGTRLVDGSVTYSSNGDGSINVYNVPLRWDGQYPAGKGFYNEMIQQTKHVEIEKGEDQEVIRLVKIQNLCLMVDACEEK